MSNKFRHNKRRNSALMYEFLARHISKCLVENKSKEAEKALEITKKYFAKGKPLSEELSLFRSILDTNVSSRHSAQKVIDSVCQSSRRLSARGLDAEKSRLIKEVNYAFQDLNFYNYKVPNYVVYASVAALLNESRNKKKSLSEVQRIQLEDVICEFLTEKKEIQTSDLLQKNPKYNRSVHRFVFERFHKKYDQKLNESQKKLLMAYSSFKISKDDSSLIKILKTETKNIKEKLSFVKDDQLREDKDLMNKLRECYRKFSSGESQKVDDETVLEVLRYMQLVDEIES